jgi:hypothetical protein
MLIWGRHRSSESVEPNTVAICMPIGPAQNCFPPYSSVEPPVVFVLGHELKRIPSGVWVLILLLFTLTTARLHMYERLR